MTHAERLQNAAAALGEHFDSVVLICTRHDAGATTVTHASRGNYHACDGSVREWLARRDERELESVRREGRDD